jgi:sugar phosphate permease
MGYMGAFAGDFVTGRLLEHYDWTITVRVWAAWAFGAALAASFLWNASATKRIAPGAGAAKEDNA